MPDAASDEVQARQEAAVEVERHREGVPAATVGPGVMLTGDANAGLVGNVAGQLQIHQGCFGAVGKTQAEALANGDQIGGCPVLIQHLHRFNANPAGFVTHA